jgi:site-specific DNA-methyltransferase (adenine-specific)
VTSAVVHVGDALQVLRTLPDASVHCCITSPPYWGLRDYGVAGQIGLEATVDDWLLQLVAVFAEVRRVLRKDGTLWLNVGDAYAGQGGGSDGHHGGLRRWRDGGRTTSKPGLARKQRLFLPHRLVMALQASGWWARDELVWHKRCPMPESARDRSTMAHEFVFLLSKRPSYFFDQEAWKEPVNGTAHPRGDGRVPRGLGTGPGGHRELRGRYEPKTQSAGMAFGGMVTHRNRRSVWTLGPEPFAGAHFATFPTALVDPMVLAGTSEGGACGACGAPRRRLVRKGAAQLEHRRACGGDANGEYHGAATKDFAAAGAENASVVKARILAGMCERHTVGWARTCKPTCAGGDVVPCVVLDPFAGAGTTGVVSVRRGRSFVGIELSPEYAAMARRRINAEAPLFVQARAAGGGA